MDYDGIDLLAPNQREQPLQCRAIQARTRNTFVIKALIEQEGISA
jgi:hypothetical protein